VRLRAHRGQSPVRGVAQVASDTRSDHPDASNPLPSLQHVAVLLGETERAAAVVRSVERRGAR
jgi:hypothetical protein